MVFLMLWYIIDVNLIHNGFSGIIAHSYYRPLMFQTYSNICDARMFEVHLCSKTKQRCGGIVISFTVITLSMVL